MELRKNYYDYAEDDRKYFQQDYENGRVANYMASMAQNICERYMKHIIDKHIEANTEAQNHEKEIILHSQNLNKLVQFIERESDFQFSTNDKRTIRSINGYYFTTRYPGEESIESVDADMLTDCAEAINICRDKVIEIEQNLEQVRQDRYADVNVAINQMRQEINNESHNNVNNRNNHDDIER